MEEVYELLQAALCEAVDQEAAMEAWREILVAGEDEISGLFRDFCAVFVQNIGMRDSYDLWLCVGYSTSDLFEELENLKIPFRGGGEAANLTTRVLIACALVAAKTMSDLTGRKPRVSDDVLRFLDFHCGEAPRYLLRPKWALPAEMHHNTPGEDATAPRF